MGGRTVQHIAGQTLQVEAAAQRLSAPQVLSQKMTIKTSFETKLKKMTATITLILQRSQYHLSLVGNDSSPTQRI